MISSFVELFIKNSYSSGSYPPFENGLHLKILLKVKKDALTKLYFLYACKEYSEQVGVKRHVGGNNGEINFL